MQKKLQKMANFQVYPTNLANPGRMGTITMTLNIMLVLRIITHAQGFESIEIFWGEGDLAAPYCCWCCEVDNLMEMSHLKYFVLFKTIAVEKVAILRHEMIILPLLNLQGASPTQPAWEVPHKKCN